MKPGHLLVFFLLILPVRGLAQDTLVLKNRDVIAGEIKVMNRGVLEIETDYSKSDFKVEWSGVVSIRTLTTFLITLSDGRRFLGRLETGADGKMRIMEGFNRTVEVKPEEVVEMRPVEENFLSRLYGNLGMGFGLTKANHYRQLDVQLKAGYRAEKWLGDGSFSMLFSRQDSISDIRKLDGNLSFYYYLPRDWFTITDVTFFSSSEQKINLRTNSNLGVGYYLLHTNEAYWGLGGGFSFNNENYYGDEDDKQSIEGLAKMNLNLFDIGDLSLNTAFAIFPGITEWGRVRTTFEINVKYDLPLDFYVSVGGSHNFDNQPAAGAPRNDYTLHTGFGWEW
jgi:hypothetical protein